MTDFIFYLIKANVAIGLFYLVYRLFLAQLTFHRINRYYLIFALLFSVISPIIPINEWFFTSKEIPANLLIRIPDWQQLQLPKEATDTTSYFSIAYWFSVIFFGLLFIIKLLGIGRIYLRSVPAKWKMFHYRETMENIAPFSFWKNIYFNPNLHPEDEYEKIFMHEQVHVSQLHSLDVLVSEIFLALFWYNPLCWMFRKSIQENLEFIADQKVLASGIDIKTYQYSLIQISNLSTHSQLGNHFNFKNLKKRIIMMNKKQSSKLHIGKYVFTLTAAVIGSLIFGVSNAYENSGIPSREEASLSIYQDTLKLNAKTNEPLYIIDGEKQNSQNKGVLDPTNIESVNVLKDTAAISAYGEEGQNGVIEITSKKKITVSNLDPELDNVILFVDGKKMPNNDLSQLNPDEIKAMSVFKGEQAIQRFGEEGKNGVVEIVTHLNKDVEINIDTQLDLDQSVDINVNTNVNENENKVSISSKGSNEEGSKDATMRHSGKIDKDVVIFVDGKEISHDQMENISPNHIKSISVYKGANAEEHFGKKGKDGVIEIFLKGDKP